MRHVLLIGAGFSRNWGGWLADEVTDYLFGADGVRDDPTLKDLLLRHRDSDGFEGALAAVQVAYLGSKSASEGERLQRFQAAIVQMFDDMDRAFIERGFEFQNDIAYLVRTFLVKFDAIFGLNQDYLLERHYLNDNVQLGSNGRWHGWQIPGMRPVHDPSRHPLDRAPVLWTPDPDGFRVIERQQPYFKLHGSSNWRSGEGEQLLVMGAGKQAAIQGHPVLRASLEAFRRHLDGPVRLMIIGYGFRDDHINEVILEAARGKALQLFVIDALGAKALDQNNKTKGGAIYVRSELDEVLSPTLIGASRRLLSDTFNKDRAEHAKIMRFFST